MTLVLLIIRSAKLADVHQAMNGSGMSRRTLSEVKRRDAAYTRAGSGAV
jgi:nitrogen regulatory protein PII